MRLDISSFNWLIVSRALDSFSWAVSTIFHNFSISYSDQAHHNTCQTGSYPTVTHAVNIGTWRSVHRDWLAYTLMGVMIIRTSISDQCKRGSSVSIPNNPHSIHNSDSGQTQVVVHKLTCFREAIVVLSSCESLRALLTLAALATISTFSSLHFVISLRSLSCDFFRARWSFSYSVLNFSKLSSPINSPRVSWKSFSRVSKVASSAAVFSSSCHGALITVSTQLSTFTKTLLTSIVF